METPNTEGRSTGPYFDPDFDYLIECIHSPRVVIDNDTCHDRTLVKVDSANKHGILLEMVQLLTDLDLVISKSYISSDGGWLMDVFHITDQLGNKLTDPVLINFIEQSLVARRRGRTHTDEVRTCLGKLVGPGHLAREHTALELTAADRSGLLSEISAVLLELDCHVTCAQAWTHNSRVACIIYLTDDGHSPITDRARLANIEEQVGIVIRAHQSPGDRYRLCLMGPAPSRVHTERRLHQLLQEDRDYEATTSSSSSCMETEVLIESWKEKGYSVVNIRSKDRPKLLFDTVCALTDMQYVVFHAVVGSQGGLAVQEYYIRHADGCTLEMDSERRRVTRCLVAAVERRASHGLRLEVCARNRPGLLLDITRVLRENGLSLTRAECARRHEMAVGTFYVTDASGGCNVSPRRMEAVRDEFAGECIALEVSNHRTTTTSDWPPVKTVNGRTSPPRAGGDGDEERPRFSLGSLLWAHIGRFSTNFGIIRP